MIFETFKRMRQEVPRAAAFLITSGDRALPIRWGQFTDDIDLVAQVLRTRSHRAPIAILGENSYEWMVVHAAVVLSGGVVTPIDPNMTAVEIAERLRFVGCSLIVHSTLYDEKVRAAMALCPGVEAVGMGERRTDVWLKAAQEALDSGKVRSIWEGDAPDAKRISMLVFTSGTTSTPRGAELTLEGLERFCEHARQMLPIEVGAHSLMLLPLHHIFGMASTYFMLSCGVALGVCPDFHRLYDAAKRFRVDFLILVPALAEILAIKIQHKGRSVEEALGQRMSWMLVGGAAVTRRTYEHLAALGVRVLTAYGLTETTALYSISSLADAVSFGAQGRVAAVNCGVETRVSADGELLIRGPNVMKGYYRSPEATARVLDGDGWLHTGDIGRIDTAGNVWITGRASRTIVLSSGKKIAPEELEEKLLSLPGISEAVVTGEELTRDVRAEVYAVTSETTVRQAIAALNQTLPVYKRIKTIAVRKEPFPRTSSGKIKIGNL